MPWSDSCERCDGRVSESVELRAESLGWIWTGTFGRNKVPARGMLPDIRRDITHERIRVRLYREGKSSFLVFFNSNASASPVTLAVCSTCFFMDPE